ncbi:glycine cleavage system H protein-like [Anneissia japonica]|uniref:glycine cleavage system H protein-like n=1 Tax=Anneissia japonica TaxID=1529436 RepID=UPI001425559D|nr:glycine cleavage system H protein-like [Anneissia japonica]
MAMSMRLLAGRLQYSASQIIKTTVFAKQTQSLFLKQSTRYFNRSCVVLTDRKFSKEHEWVTVVNDIGTIGISDYAQDALGDLVFVDLPDIGTKFFKGDEFGALESVKAASDLYMPVSGEVTETNATLEDDPAIINKDPYDKGWILKVKLSNVDELEELMTEDQYTEFLKSEE